MLGALALVLAGCTGIVGGSLPGDVVQSETAVGGGSGGTSVVSLDPALPGPAPNVPLPADYRTWPPFLLNVQRTDNLQVRDIYINSVGAATQEGAPFPEGTIMVMDLIDVQKDSAGAALLDPSGKLLRASRLKTYVMEKNVGWGNFVPAQQRTGDWLYSAYASDGVTELKDPTTACFTCHLPLGESVDWVHRYAEYFQKRSAAATVPNVALPSDYRTWAPFLLNVQRPDNLQVRDIYINAVGAAAQQGAPFPEGTILVMDLIDVQKNSAGAALLDPSGNLLRASRLKTYVMEKNVGWGNFAPAGQGNGDWLYSAYASDGVTELKDPTTACFTCHLPLGASLDWVQRYDEYFKSRPAVSN